jgi:hypothetical protein
VASWNYSIKPTTGDSEAPILPIANPAPSNAKAVCCVEARTITEKKALPHLRRIEHTLTREQNVKLNIRWLYSASLRRGDTDLLTSAVADEISTDVRAVVRGSSSVSGTSAEAQRIPQ